MVDSVVSTQGFFGSMDPKELNDIFLNTNVYSQMNSRLQKLDDNRVQNNLDLLRIENVKIEHMKNMIEATEHKFIRIHKFIQVTTSLKDDIDVLHTRLGEEAHELQDAIANEGASRQLDIQDLKERTVGDFQRIRDRLVTTISFGTDFALYWHMNKTTNQVSLQKVPECVICMDKVRDIKITACKHVICCRSCFLQLEKAECPGCRGPIAKGAFELLDWKEELKDVPLNNTSVDDDKMIMSGIFKDTRTQFERLCI
jgi:hypothetical protein